MFQSFSETKSDQFTFFFVFLSRTKIDLSVMMEANFPEEESIMYVSDSLGFAAMEPSLRDPSLEDNDFSETSKFISQILMEENVQERPFYD